MTSKQYYTVQDEGTLRLMLEHIQTSDTIAVDTETNSLNPRKGKIIGWSVSGAEGVGFYLPTLVWNEELQELELQSINGTSSEVISTNLLKQLKGKRLVFHNASFDIRFIKNYFGVDLLEDLWVDTAMLVHTVNEEGAFGHGSPFALKSIAIMDQEALGLNMKEAANQEQVELKRSIHKNGGSTTKADFQIFKADLEILSKYASADTDLTLRICNLYLKRLKEQSLSRFFFDEEVMPIYREVTIPMEEYGCDLDMDLLHKTNEDIIADQERLKKTVIKSLLSTAEAQQWVIDTALREFPPSNKGRYAQAFIRKYGLKLPTTNAGKFSVSNKYILLLEDSPQKQFLLEGDVKVMPEADLISISMDLWREKNGGDYINVQSKKHLGEVVFDYMGIKPLVDGKDTKSGRAKFDMDMIVALAKTHPWAESLRIYNKLLKVKSTYIDRFLDGAEDGRFYFYFKQNGTVSGRYGSNAQQLPKPLEEGQDVEEIAKYVNIVRAFLVAGKGRKVIDADYESLEPHCLDPEGLVNTTRGYTRLDDLQVGDVILTSDQSPKTVRAKWYSDKPVVNITTADGVIRASKDHRFFVEGKGWRTVSEIEEGDQISYENFSSLGPIREALPIYFYKTSGGEPLTYKEQSPEDCWMVGALLGDGSFHNHGISMCGLLDDGVLGFFHNYFEKLGFKVSTYNERHSNASHKKVYNASLYHHCKTTWGIVDGSSRKITRVPTWVFDQPVLNKVAFLAGVVDTDGRVCRGGCELTISTKHGRFATDLITLFGTIGITARLGVGTRDQYRWYTVRLGQAACCKLHSLGYNAYTKHRNKSVSHKTPYRDALKMPRGTVQSIHVSEDTIRMVDITVDGEEFLMDGFRTHNCFASVSGDENLQEIFAKNWDFYSTVAIRTENLKGVVADKKADNYLKKVDPVKRQTAKSYALGVAYGMGAYALSMNLGVSQEKAEKLIEGYLDGFPGLKQWREDSREFVKTHGYIQNYVGRVRHLPRVKATYEAFGDKILDWRFRRDIESLGHSKEEVMRVYKDYRNGLNSSLNYQLQSLAAAVVNRAALAINRKAKELGIDAVVQAQVHDQLIINVAEEDAERFAPVVQEIMETNLQLPGVTLKAPPEISNNWRDGH